MIIYLITIQICLKTFKITSNLLNDERKKKTATIGDKKIQTNLISVYGRLNNDNNIYRRKSLTIKKFYYYRFFLYKIFIYFKNIIY